jgi:hypothetical protein
MATVLSNAWKTVVIIFDAAIETGRNFSAGVTSHPVETGVNVSDHVTIENPKFTVKGVISDAAFLTPYEQINSLGNTIGSALGLVQKESRSLTALQDLQFLLNNRDFLTLQFGNEPPYENLILTKLNVPKDKNVGDAYVFDLEFEQVRVVSSRYTTVQAKRVAKPADENLSDKSTAAGNSNVPKEDLTGVDASKDAAPKTYSRAETQKSSIELLFGS